MARTPAVVPSGNPGVRLALVRLLAVPERPGSGPQEHPFRLLHRRQEQEDPAEAGESDNPLNSGHLIASCRCFFLQWGKNRNVAQMCDADASSTSASLFQ